MIEENKQIKEGTKFGEWIVIKNVKNKGDRYKCLCRCSCGEEKEINNSTLLLGKSNKCIKCHYNKMQTKNDDIIGKKFNSLYVAHIRRSHGKRWAQCICDCGVRMETRPANLIKNRIKSCGCKDIKNPVTIQKRYKDILGAYWKNIMHGAMRRDLEFSITMEEVWNIFEKQNKVCIISGLPIHFGKDATASIDRIDNSKGYISGNIQIVHKFINRIKFTYKDDELIYIARKIAENNKDRKIENIDIDKVKLNNCKNSSHLNAEEFEIFKTKENDD